MIGTVDIKVNAAHPNMPLSPVYTFLGSPQQVRIINVPKQIGNWKITAVQITVNYPDNSSPSVEATLTGGCWSATLPAPSAVGQSLMGFKVTASGVDEHNDPVTGYVLGKGDAYVLDDDATITVGGTTYYVHMLDAVPESPRKGDLAVIDNIYQLYDGSRWHPLGNQATISWSDITGKPTAFPPSAHTHTQSEIAGLADSLSAKIDKSSVSAITPDLDSDESSAADIMNKVNSLIMALKGASAALAVIFAFSAFSAVEVQTAKLSTLPGKTMVVTNVTGAASTEEVAAKYTKPSGGIPKTDLASAVQTSLGKADSAVQPAAISDMATKSNLAGKIDVEYSPYESSTNRFEWNEAGFKVTAGRWGHLNYHEEEGVHIQFEDTFLTLLPQDAGQIVWRYPRGNKGGCLSLPSKNGVLATTSDLPTDSTISGWGYIKSYSETDPTVDGKISTHNSSSSAHADIRQSVSAKYSKPSSGIPKTDLASAVQTSLGKADSAVQPAAISDMETQTHAAATYQPKGSYLTSETDPTVDNKLAPIETIVSAWQTYWDGDDVRVTVTNYYGSQDLPSLYIEQKISDGGTNYYKTIWTEKARLNVIFDRLLQLESDVATKADRAWGYYDSHAGTYAPDGFTSISSGSILVSKDMSYQKTVTSAGEVWVLTATDPTVITGAETNGFFRISDSEGNSIFEVVKGDKRIAPATVSSVTAGGNSLTINFNVESAAHPSLEICSDLVDADWKAEDEASCPATVVWSGTSGSYVATVTGKAAMPKMFVKGTYEVGGETYARHGVPLGFDRVVIGGVFYRVAVETVSGKKLMTLTEL